MESLEGGYAKIGYYVSQLRRFGAEQPLVDIEVPISKVCDYFVIVVCDQDSGKESEMLWIENEDHSRILVRDTRNYQNGLAGVRWASDYNGSAHVVVEFSDPKNVKKWGVLVGRRPYVENKENKEK